MTNPWPQSETSAYNSAGLSDQRTDGYVHIQSGTLYFSNGVGQAVIIPGGEDELLTSAWLRSADCVYVLGCEENASLISRLWLSQLQFSKPRVLKLASPLLCGATPAADPADVLVRMVDLNFAPSVGGWHTAMAADFQTFELLRRRRQLAGELSQDCRLMLRSHPAYPALSFIRGFSEVASVDLLCRIGDPRFFVDPAYPDRSSRLRRHMDVSGDKALAAASAALFASGAAETSSELSPVFRCLLPGLRALASEGSSCFHRDIVSAAGAGSDAAVAAMLRVSGVFLRFVCSVWVAFGWPRVRGSRHTGRGTELFVPEYFFRRADDLADWHKHLGSS